MRKIHFLSLLLFIFICIPQFLFAHTISQHLEELYGDTYLPFYIISKLLLFVGLGMLAFNIKKIKSPFQFRLLFFASIIPGMILGFHVEGGDFTLMYNNIGILLAGVLLLFNFDTSTRRFDNLFLLFGLTIGFEYGRYISHTGDLVWFYIILLSSGLIVFLLLNNLRFIGNSKRNYLRYGAALFLIIVGIIVVLLT